jgi:hypothetical protein
MNTDKLKQKLIAAARTAPADDRVPYAFEKRVMAHIRSQPAPDAAALWARALWRAAVPCVAVTLLLGALSFVPAESDTAMTTDLSDNYEQAMLVSLDEQEELW